MNFDWQGWRCLWRTMFRFRYFWILVTTQYCKRSLPWNPWTWKGYAFPPFSLMTPILKNVSQDKADLVVVTPVWQAQPWWPPVLNLLMKNSVMIPNSKHLLRDPASPLRIHFMYPSLHLAIFYLSGKGFQRTLPDYSNQHFAPPHLRHTSQPVDYGIKVW